MGRPSKKEKAAVAPKAGEGEATEATMEVPAEKAAGKRARVRTAEQKDAAKADMGRSYFRNKKWPRIVKHVRQFCADPAAYDGGVVLAALTPLLLDPDRPVEPLPPRRSLPASLVEEGKRVRLAYLATTTSAVPVLPATNAADQFEVDT
jgi:hypothetical protein